MGTILEITIDAREIGLVSRDVTAQGSYSPRIGWAADNTHWPLRNRGEMRSSGVVGGDETRLFPDRQEFK